jgi:uncharacterized protein
MKNKITISIGEVSIEAELNDTNTAKKILEQLPLESEANLWGEEVYFSIPVKHDLEDPKEEVDIGELAFWPQGSAFCIFFGKTPASVNDRPRPISPVTPIGKISNQKAIEDMKKVRISDAIKITCLED